MKATSKKKTKRACEPRVVVISAPDNFIASAQPDKPGRRYRSGAILDLERRVKILEQAFDQTRPPRVGPLPLHAFVADKLSAPFCGKCGGGPLSEIHAILLAWEPKG